MENFKVSKLSLTNRISKFNQSSDVINDDYAIIAHQTLEQSNCFLNIDLWNLQTAEFETPDTDGDDIPTRIGHSFTRISDSAGLVFGGERKHIVSPTEIQYEKLNDLYQCSITEPGVITVKSLMASSTLEDGEKIPAPRAWHSATAVEMKTSEDEYCTKLFIAGGVDTEHQTTLADIWLYSPESNSWEELSPTGPSPLPLAYHTCTYMKDSNSVIVIGGHTTNEQDTNVHLLNLDSLQWSTVETSSPIPKYCLHSTIVLHNAEENECLGIFGNSQLTLVDPTNDFAVTSFDSGSLSLDDPKSFIIGSKQKLFVFSTREEASSVQIEFGSASALEAEESAVEECAVEEETPPAVNRFADTNEVYDGEWNGDKREGSGKFTFADSSTYTGEWLNDKRHGFGKFTCDSMSYEGYWEDDLYHGKGVKVEEGGIVVEGEFCRGECPTTGVIKYQNESKTYTGGIKDCKAHGTGVLVVRDDACRYEGSFVNGVKKGYGVQEYADGSIYDGEWIADKRNGIGNFKDMTDQSVYDGKWIGDVRCGKGRCKYGNDSIYTGLWKNDLPNGFGKLESSDGKSTKEGMWKNGSFISTTTATEPKEVDSNNGDSPLVNEIR